MSDHESPVEQSASAVAGPRGKELTLRQKLAIATLLGIVALGVIWFNALVGRHKPEPEKSNVAAAGVGQKYTPPPVIPVKVQAADLPLPPDNAAGTALPPTNTNPPPIFAYSGGGTMATARPEVMPVQMPDSSVGPGATATLTPAALSATADSTLARKLKATVLSGSIASVVKDPDMVITEGTVVPCTLQTGINTQLPGS